MKAWVKNYMIKKGISMTEEQAHKRKYRASIVYAIVSWHVFVYLIYSTIKERHPGEITTDDYLKAMGQKDAQVIKYSGFTRLTDKNDSNVTIDENDKQLY